MPADVVFAMASSMNAQGWFALSLGTDYTMAAVAKARVVVLEVNPNVPFAHGQCHVHISQVTSLVESSEPILEVGLPAIGPVQEAIGKYVADMIEDGSTLQIGYGGIPDAVVMQLTHKQDLGVHTEMIGDGILTLVDCGAVTNRKKTLLPGKMVATFALGSRRLYDFMHHNPMLEMHPSNFTNDPYIAGQNDKLVSINASLQVDLLGQCGSESIAHLPYSGTGGQVDFVRAANRSRGGKSFIVLPSTAKDGSISRIVPMLTPGTHATTSKNDVNYVVTEYGVAQLRGKSAKQRAQELIAIAHPGFPRLAARRGEPDVRVLTAGARQAQPWASRRARRRLPVVLHRRHRALRAHRHRGAHRAALVSLAGGGGAGQRRLRTAGRGRHPDGKHAQAGRRRPVPADAGGDAGPHLHAAAAGAVSGPAVGALAAPAGPGGAACG